MMFFRFVVRDSWMVGWLGVGTWQHPYMAIPTISSMEPVELRFGILMTCPRGRAKAKNRCGQQTLYLRRQLKSSVQSSFLTLITDDHDSS